MRRAEEDRIVAEAARKAEEEARKIAEKEQARKVKEVEKARKEEQSTRLRIANDIKALILKKKVKNDLLMYDPSLASIKVDIDDILLSFVSNTNKITLENEESFKELLNKQLTYEKSSDELNKLICKTYPDLINSKCDEYKAREHEKTNRNRKKPIKI